VSPKREIDETRPGQGPDPKVAEEAAEAKAAEGVERAEETAEGPEGEAKPKRRRRGRAKAKADETAAGTPEAAEAARASADEDVAAEPDPEPDPEAAAVAEEAEADGVAAADGDDVSAEEAAGEDDDAPAPKGSRRGDTRPRRKREPAAPAVDLTLRVRAHAKYVRTSARKARLVCDHIRGKSVDQARAILAYTPRAAARDWSKVLESAVANAEHNHELVGDELRVAEVYADEGPTLKRYRPRAMGRATRIRKRTSHLTITLAPKEPR